MGDRKKVSILIPCFNEEENVVPMSNAVVEMFEKQLPQYDYELLFIDNDSRDNTRPLLRQICKQNPKVKAIFNAKNFGQFNSPYYGILQTSGDCVISMVCDFQDPLELIPQYLEAWEEGYKIVIGVKSKTKEGLIMRGCRTLYYKLLHKMSQVDIIEHFTGSGLYDRDFVEVLRDLKDPTPFLRGIVAELGYRRKEIPYEQPKRRAGKTHNNFFTLYDAAMLSFTSYTKTGLRLATFLGMLLAFGSFMVGMVYLILKLCYWDRFDAGTAPLLIGIFFIGSILLFFMGLMGEYIISINQRVMNRPLVIEEERINFDPEDKPERQSGDDSPGKQEQKS